jgi:hypothetical protein
MGLLREKGAGGEKKVAALDFLTFYFTDSLQMLKNRRHFPQDKGATGRESRTFKEKLLCE